MLGESADPLNLLAVQCASIAAELDTIVFGGIMRGRDHAAAICVQMEEGEIEQRSRHKPDIHNIAAGSPKPFNKRGSEGLRAQPVIATHRQTLATPLTDIGAKGEPDALHIDGIEITSYDASDVILPENLRVHHMLQAINGTLRQKRRLHARRSPILPMPRSS